MQNKLTRKVGLLALVAGVVTFSVFSFVSAATTVGTNLSTTGTLSVTGASTLSSTLGVSGAATLSDNLTVNGNTVLGNAATDTVTAAGLVYLGGDATTNAFNTTPSTLLVTMGSTTVTGTTTLNGNIILGNAATDTVIAAGLTYLSGNATTNALNTNPGTLAVTLGTTTIAGITISLSGGSSTIDLSNASNDVLTITNSGAGTSSLLVEGIAKGGYAVINGDGAGTSSVMADVITLTMSSAANVYGFAPCSDRSITNWAGRTLTVLGSSTQGGTASFISSGTNAVDTMWLDTNRTVTATGRGVLTLVCDGTSWYEKSWNLTD